MPTVADSSHSGIDDTTQWDQNEWSSRLQDSGRRLIELHALTENSFLEIGESLQNFYTRAKKVSGSAGSIAEELLGEDASRHLGQLQQLVERMSLFLGQIRESSQRNEASLREICRALDQLKSPLGAFQKITKTLQVVGITTRVECSGHVETGTENSSVLSDSLRRLADLIAGNMEAIIEQVGLLRALSEEALENEAALNNGQSSRAQEAIEHVRSVMVELGANHERAADKSERIARSSSDISKSIGEIVSSMQFHDITRQQIEHVSQTIESLSHEIEQTFVSRPESRETLEMAVAEGCRLQSEQLGHARIELSAAVWRIIESLQTLSGSVTGLTRDTCDLAGSTEQDGATYFAALEPAIESVTTILVENSNTAAKSLQAVVNVVCAAEEMSTLVEEIERFGAEMKVLSLNASVEAVHAKRGGSSLSIIADSIQDLANEALLQTESLAASLKRITHFAETLGSSDMTGSLDRSKEVDQLTGDAGTVLEELRQRKSSLSETLADVEQTAGILAVDIADMAASIRIHEQAEQILTAACKGLDRIVERFPATSGILDQVQHIPIFKEMQHRYSMKSERDIHLRVLKQAGDKVEDQQKEKNGSPGAGSKPENLGNNVELF